MTPRDRPYSLGREQVTQADPAGHELVDRLESLDAEIFARSALHPRLNVQMRLVDMLFFQAEHDDYHLARISELKKLLAKK